MFNEHHIVYHSGFPATLTVLTCSLLHYIKSLFKHVSFLKISNQQYYGFLYATRHLHLANFIRLLCFPFHPITKILLFLSLEKTEYKIYGKTQNRRKTCCLFSKLPVFIP